MSTDDKPLLPRAKLRDVLRGKAPLVGSRCDPDAPRGFVSPIEARLQLGLATGDAAEEERKRLARRSTATDMGTVARSLAAAALWPSAQGRTVTRPHLVSAAVENVRCVDALDLIFAPPRGDRARMIHFVHAHALNLATFMPAFAAQLAAADHLLPDGIGLRVAASILGIAMRDNVNGTDLLPMLCAEAARRSVPLVLVGSEPGVAEACARRLMGDAAGLEIPLISHGFLSDAEARELAREVGKLRGAIVLVGMGSPVQEQWAWKHLASVAGVTVLTVGGLFDFFSGKVPRAPRAWRELGLEWLYRLGQEPGRLGARYLLGNPLFVALACKQRLMGPPAWS